MLSETLKEKLHLEEKGWIQSLVEYQACSRPIDKAAVKEITQKCRYDVNEASLDTKTLISLLTALYPITPSASQTHVCGGVYKDGRPCGDCDPRHLFDECCKMAAAKVYAKVTDYTWQDSTCILKLLRRVLSTKTTEATLTKGLVDIIASWVVGAEMSSLNLAKMYRISGGLHKERADAVEHCTRGDEFASRFQTTNFGSECVVLLHENDGGCLDIPRTKIYTMTCLGSKLFDASGARAICYHCPYNPALTPYEVTKEKLRVTIRPACAADRGMTDEATKSLQWVYEKSARPKLVLEMDGSVLIDADSLPAPPAITIDYTLCGMPRFLHWHVPPCANNADVWGRVYTLRTRLQTLRTMRLFNSKFRIKDVVNLCGWLPLLENIQVADNEWILKDGKLLIDVDPESAVKSKLYWTNHKLCWDRVSVGAAKSIPRRPNSARPRYSGVSKKPMLCSRNFGGRHLTRNTHNNLPIREKRR